MTKSGNTIYMPHSDRKGKEEIEHRKSVCTTRVTCAGVRNSNINLSTYCNTVHSNVTLTPTPVHVHDLAMPMAYCIRQSDAHMCRGSLHLHCGIHLHRAHPTKTLGTAPTHPALLPRRACLCRAAPHGQRCSNAWGSPMPLSRHEYHNTDPAPLLILSRS